LKELDSVCNILQYERRTLAGVRVLFDACIEKYPVMKEHLSAGANIVHSAAFENAVVKLANEMPLSNAERRGGWPVSGPNDRPSRDDTADEDFATAILGRAKKPRRSGRGLAGYVPLLSAIPPTSNHYERLFSQCRYVLTPIVPASTLRILR
jgi:hypothetical protein